MTTPLVAPAPVAHEAVPRRRRLWLRSLSSKLVAGVVVLVLVLVAAIGVSTYFALRSFLLNRLDQQVSATVAQNTTYLYSCLVGSGRCGFEGPPPTSAEYLVVLTYSGALYAEPGSDPPPNLYTLTLSAAERKAIVAHPSQLRQLSVDGVELRVGSRATRSGYVVVTGLPLADVDRTLHRLVNLELIIGTAAVVIAFVASTWGAQRGLRNLYKVTGTAREVTAELSPEGAGLDRRVPVVEEGTEVGQLAESVNTLLSAVETQFAARLESEHRMRQFMADASHELRTPLTSIRGYAELARMQRAVGESADDNLDRIESEGTRMSRLVEDLLVLARGDDVQNAREPVREPVDIPTLVDDAVAGARASFPDRRIDLQVTPLPFVRGDRDQLLRVVRNLVTNACVHTAPERPMLARAYLDGAEVVVQIIDGGPGLPPEEAARVFERFWRADKARTRARGGSGLGMSIVATLVQANGGSVYFDSTVDRGSTVTVRLPAAFDVTPAAEVDD